MSRRIVKPKSVFDAYLTKEIRVKIQGTKDAHLILPEDTAVKVDVIKERAYYGVYEIFIDRMSYSVVI